MQTAASKDAAFGPFNFTGRFIPDDVFASTQSDDFKFPSMELTSISEEGLATISFSDDFFAIEDISSLKSKGIYLYGSKKSAIEILVKPEEG